MLIDSERAMLKLGADFAKQLRAPALIELLGDLGAGKTTFTRGLAQGLGVTDVVSLQFLATTRARNIAWRTTISIGLPTPASWPKIYANPSTTPTPSR